MPTSSARACGTQWDDVVPQAPAAQLKLPLEPGLTVRHHSLKDCVAASIYRQRGGIAAVAGRLDMSPSHLSEVLGGGGGERGRKFDLDELECYLEAYGDVTPVLYLIARFLPDVDLDARAKLVTLQERLDDVVAAFGQQRSLHQPL